MSEYRVLEEAFVAQAACGSGFRRRQRMNTCIAEPTRAVREPITEASVLNASSARTRTKRRSDAAMREVVAFVRSALQPAQPWNIRSLIRVAEGLRERQERLVDR